MNRAGIRSKGHESVSAGRKCIVTGGAGFIGSALVRHLLDRGEIVHTVDSLSYAGRMENLAEVEDSPRHRLHRLDIQDRAALRELVLDLRPDAIFHLAAETHVDRSIDGPAAFVHTNIVGTFNVLEAAREVAAANAEFRLVHVSTDEVFGALGETGRFTETSPYRPNSPYAASKAAADHLARAWHETFSLPVLVTNCSNNYGPRQFPEKLIPLTIANALEGRPIRIYGDGLQVRDWLYVEDHVRGLVRVLDDGRPGATYNIGGNCERTNREVVHTLLERLASHVEVDVEVFRGLVTHVQDRPGHDRRYAIHASLAERELGWVAETSFEDGMDATVAWYCDHPEWRRSVMGSYNGGRLGTTR